MLETLKNIWDGFVEFLSANDANTLAEKAQKVDFAALLTDPLFWFVSIVLIGLAVWRKQIKLMVLAVSLVAFFFLLQMTLPSAGKALSLEDLVKFGGGTLALIGLNFYFLLIREK
jgi:hypothetical protein